jgi:hypothetical protein
MKSLFLVFWNICLLRRGPELVPTHPLFIGVIVLADVAVSLMLSLKFDSELRVLPAFTYILVTLAVSASVVWFALYLKDFETRFPATIAAIFGCDLVLSTLMLIIVQFTAGPENPFAIGTVLLTSVWSIAITGFILHRAMSISLFAGVLLSVAMALFSVSVGNVATVG